MKKLLFETEYWQIYICQDQAYFGRSLILLKRECEHLSGLEKVEINDFFEITRKIENVFKNKFQATMFNWTCLMNNAYKKDSVEKPQVHWHCRPRYKNAVYFSEKTFVDPNFGHHYLRGKENEKNVSEEFLNELVNFINN